MISYDDLPTINAIKSQPAHLYTVMQQQLAKIFNQGQGGYAGQTQQMESQPNTWNKGE